MKQVLFTLLLLAGLIISCAGPSAPGGLGCIENGELCVKLTAQEPIILGNPVTVTITVTTKKDIPGIKIGLISSSAEKVAVEDPISRVWKENGASWSVEAKAGNSLTFTRRIRLPAKVKGVYQLISIQAQVGDPNIGAAALDELTMYITDEGGKVYYSGTKVPITPGPIQTIIITPGPSATSALPPISTAYP